MHETAVSVHLEATLETVAVAIIAGLIRAADITGGHVITLTQTVEQARLIYSETILQIREKGL